MELDENDIARYLDGRVSESEREQIERHLAECRTCREEVAQARRILKGVQEENAPSLDPDTRRRADALGAEERGRKRVLSRLQNRPVATTTAVVLLAIVGVLYWHAQGPSRTNGLRSTPGEAPVSVRAPADGAKLSERPVFRCEKVPNAYAYRVTLYAQDGMVLWEGDTTVPRVTLPTHISLSEGRTYLWRATVLRTNGTTLQSSLYRFTYSP